MNEQSATTGDFFHGDVPGGIERIRRRLLDLTNRNRLLNFRHTKRASLRIVDEMPDQLFEVLADGKDFVFAPVPRPRRGPPGDRASDTAAERRSPGGPSAADHALTLGISTSFELPEPKNRSAAAPRHVDRAIQTLHFPEELESILRSLTSAARLAIEETGSNMLYLVFGFLDWYESDDSDQVRSAPLLLFPVSLERGLPDPHNGVFRYRLRYAGEDVFANLCLQEKLRQDFGLVLPDLDPDETPEAYFRRVTRLIGQRERWAVRRQVTVTLLSFGKMLMYRDLDARNWPRSGGPANHPRVREFFEGRKYESVPLAGDYRLDEIEASATLPVLIDNADSSQHSVLIDAGRGQNLVVMGPPGTGKSQTITNLIASAISEGKRVLFVSEKLAALEVVRHRLDRAGLGIFCLELHSHKTQKKALIDDLRTRLNVRGRFQNPLLLGEKLASLNLDPAV